MLFVECCLDIQMVRSVEKKLNDKKIFNLRLDSSSHAHVRYFFYLV